MAVFDVTSLDGTPVHLEFDWSGLDAAPITQIIEVQHEGHVYELTGGLRSNILGTASLSGVPVSLAGIVAGADTYWGEADQYSRSDQTFIGRLGILILAGAQWGLRIHRYNTSVDELMAFAAALVPRESGAGWVVTLNGPGVKVDRRSAGIIVADSSLGVIQSRHLIFADLSRIPKEPGTPTPRGGELFRRESSGGTYFTLIDRRGYTNLQPVFDLTNPGAAARLLSLFADWQEA